MKKMSFGMIALSKAFNVNGELEMLTPITLILYIVVLLIYILMIVVAMIYSIFRAIKKLIKRLR